MSALCFKRWSPVILILSALVGNAFARHFNPLDSQTGATLTIFLETAAHPTLNGTPISNSNIVPDEIGVFDSLGNCWGVGYSACRAGLHHCRCRLPEYRLYKAGNDLRRKNVFQGMGYHAWRNARYG